MVARIGVSNTGRPVTSSSTSSTPVWTESTVTGAFVSSPERKPTRYAVSAAMMITAPTASDSNTASVTGP